MNCPICKTEYDSLGRCPNCGFHDSMDFLAHPTVTQLTGEDMWEYLRYKDRALRAASEPRKTQLPTEKKASAINVYDGLKAAPANAAQMPERAFLFLEDGKWQDADIYCEKVLDQDPKNAEAYLGKLMAELKVKNRAGLADCAEPFDNRENYAKVIRFGDEALEAELRGYIAHINERNELARLTNIYNSAVKAMNAAKTEDAYKSAANIFKSVSGFKDADVLAEKCLDKAEVCRKAAKKRKKIIAVAVCIAFVIVLTMVIIPNSETLSSAKVGDTITFGAYEQDNNTSNGKEDIEWLVLAKEDDKILVISEYAIDCQQYNTSYTNVTWETCSLREWLNGTFLNAAFSTEEAAMIATTTVTADKNPDYSTNPGNDTKDKIFLLSITEAEKYFSSDEDRMCAPTAYAKAQGADTSSSNGNCWWWLRSPGGSQVDAADVFYVGSVFCSGSYVDYDNFCVRPALWIDLDA